MKNIKDFLQEVEDVFFNGPFPKEEMDLMASVTINHHPDVIFDWGTHLGYSARFFYEIEQYFSLGYKVHTIDLEEEKTHEEKLPLGEIGKIFKELNINQHFGNGVEKALEIFRLEKYKKPLFFVDGDHQEKTVLEELRLIFETVPLPLVLVHDSWSKGENNGPFKACCWAKEHFKLEMISVDDKAPGVTFLKRKTNE